MPIFDGDSGNIIGALLKAIVPDSMGTPDEQLMNALAMRSPMVPDPATGGYSSGLVSNQAGINPQATQDALAGRGPMTSAAAGVPSGTNGESIDPYNILSSPDERFNRQVEEMQQDYGVERIPSAIPGSTAAATLPRSKREIILSIINLLTEAKRGWDMGAPAYNQVRRAENMQDQILQRQASQDAQRQANIQYDRSAREWENSPATRRREEEATFASRQRLTEEALRNQRAQRLEEGRAQGWTGDTLARYVLAGQVPREDTTQTQFEQTYWPDYKRTHPEATIEQAWQAYNQAMHIPTPSFQFMPTEGGGVAKLDVRSGQGGMVEGLEGKQKAFSPTASAFDQQAYQEAYDKGIQAGMSPAESHRAALSVGSRGHAGTRASGGGPSSGTPPKATASLRSQAQRTAEKMAMMDVIDQLPGSYDPYTKTIKTPEGRKLYKERYKQRFDEEWENSKRQLGITGDEGGEPAVTKEKLLSGVADALERLNKRIESAQQPQQKR